MANPAGSFVWYELLSTPRERLRVNDGTVIRLKTVVTDILRVDGARDANGNQVYLLRSSQVISVSPSERSRKPTDNAPE